MPETLKVRKVGNSSGVILPKRLLEERGVEEGDELFAVREADGSVRLTPYDPEFAEAIENVREFMDFHRTAFRELAKEVLTARLPPTPPTPMVEAGQVEPPEEVRPGEWKWLSVRLVETLHAETLSRFGGTEGLREEDLLENALAGPRSLGRCEEPSVWELAAAYCEDLVQNHPFADGNKRAGVLAARAFLFKNGIVWTRTRQKRSQ